MKTSDRSIKGLIDSYLHSSFAPHIVDRGRRIMKRGDRVILKSIRDDHSIDFEVLGTEPYAVRVKVGEDQFEGECSCPCNFMCKHLAAALFHISKHGFPVKEDLKADIQEDKETGTQEIEPQKRNSGEPIPVPGPSDLDPSTLIRKKGMVSRWTIELERGIYSFSDNIAEDQVLQVELKPPPWSRENPSALRFWWDENIGLLTDCDCNEEVEHFCEHQERYFAYIIYYLNNPSFFQYLDPKARNNRKKEVAELYGIPDEVHFDRLFYFGLTHAGPDLVPSEEGRDLWSPGNEIDEADPDQGAAPELSMGIPVQDAFDDQTAKRRMGFVLWTEPAEDPLLKGLWLEPVTGGLTKRGKLSNRIDSYFRDRGDVHLEPLELDLLNQSGGLDPERILPLLGMGQYRQEELMNVQDRLEDQKVLFRNFQKLSPLLQEIPHLFVARPEKHPPFSRMDIDPVDLDPLPVKPRFRLEWDGTCYVFRFFLYNREIDLDPSEKKVALFQFFIIQVNRSLYRIDSLKSAMTVRYFIDQPVMRLFPDKLSAFFRNFIDPLSKSHPIEIKNMEEKQLPIEPVSKKLYVSEFDKFILFRPLVSYDDGRELNILQEGDPIEKSEDNGTIYRYQRDQEFESSFRDLMQELHPKFQDQRHPEFFHLKMEEMTRSLWFFKAFEILEEHGVEVHGLKDLKRFNYSTRRPSSNIQVHSGEDWFDVNIDVKFGSEALSLEDLRKAVVDRNRYVKLGDGTIGVLPEQWFDQLQKYFRNGEQENGALKIPKQRFNTVEELFEEHADEGVLEEIREKQKKLADFEGIRNYRRPKELQAELRDYQKAGYKWMRFLSEFGWGGILADDMGLGKTLQVLAFLRHRQKKTPRSSLVVVPTTLIFNWTKEAEKFTPDLELYFHHGPSRSEDPGILKEHDIVITSYGTLVNDIELFREYLFDTIVLDESQAIKNPSSKRFKAVRLLRGKFRFTLTGTPIENNTLDLYAQMDFANPGMLGPLNHFKEEYALPVDRDKDPDRAEELRKLVKPFILRRTKEQVIRELPGKTEDHFFCVMEPEQRKVYDAVRAKYRDKLMNKIEKDGLGNSKVQVLEGLTKLRQVCDSPALLSEDGDYGSDSVKIRELMHQIREKTHEHKLLVFSQFVSMLGEIAKELEHVGIPYEYLDGQCSVKDRQASVDRFQNEPEDHVFLISLKAGGQGLNLTAADYVFLVDPWWNPAVENQAIDRCYRIGQDKKVIAYRMICKDTIEEKILRYQDRKKALASDLIQTEGSIMKDLDKKDIEELFS